MTNPFARILDQAGIDLVLVGDSLATTRLGHDSTLPLRVKDLLAHLEAVRRGLQRALLVADLPYGSYHLSSKGSPPGRLEVRQGGRRGGEDRRAEPSEAAWSGSWCELKFRSWGTWG